MAKKTQNEHTIHLISNTHPLAFRMLLVVVQEQEMNMVYQQQRAMRQEVNRTHEE